MRKPKKRDNSYFERRLEREHPAIYARLRAGAIRSVRAAAIEAGILRRPTALNALKRDWRLASVTEKRAFIAWLKGAPKVALRGSDIVGPDGKLTPSAVTKLQYVMSTKGLKHGQVMKAMGFKALDPRLGFALSRQHQLEPVFFDRLAEWLSKV